MTTFRDLGVADELCAALEVRNIFEPFPIQELTIPLGVEGADVIGQARTGTGKTLAFGLPLLQRIDIGQGGVRALVVTPTRELTLQVANDLEAAGAKIGVRVLTVYGGVPIETQTKALRTGTIDVVVGTPGRLLDQYRRGNLVLSDVSVLVLDEADEMLDMGFLPDVETLIAACGEHRQTMLFSATMPSEVVALARRYMQSPTFIRAESGEPQVAPETEQYFFIVHRLDKPRLLARILQAPTAGQTTVFVSTKRMADRLVEELGGLGVAAEPIHGDLGQARRERNLDRFRSGKSDVLVATEVAARGLDIPGVTHVVNYDCPDDEKMYLHRIGRTGRAGAPGVAITFVEHREVDRMKSIRKRVESGKQEPEEIFSTSERLKELFDLPDETPWGHLARGTRQRSAPRAADDSEGRGRESGQRRGGRDQAATGGRRRESRERAGTDGKGTDRNGADKSADRRSADKTTDRKTSARSADRKSSDASADRKTADARGGKRGSSRRSRPSEPTSSPGGRRTAERAPSDSRGDAGSEPERVRVRERTVPDRSEQDDGRSREAKSGGRQSKGGREDSRGGRQQTAGRDGRGGGGRGGASGRGDRGRSRQGSDTAEPRGPEVRPTRSGDDARGDGRPTVDRRVKVEHIP